MAHDRGGVYIMLWMAHDEYLVSILGYGWPIICIKVYRIIPDKSPYLMTYFNACNFGLLILTDKTIFNREIEYFNWMSSYFPNIFMLLPPGAIIRDNLVISIFRLFAWLEGAWMACAGMITLSH